MSSRLIFLSSHHLISPLCVMRVHSSAGSVLVNVTVRATDLTQAQGIASAITAWSDNDFDGLAVGLLAGLQMVLSRPPSVRDSLGTNTSAL